MIGKVIEIGKSTVVVELTLTDEQKRGIINYHVAFDMEGSTIIGEIASIEKTTAHISLLGETLLNKWKHLSLMVIKCLTSQNLYREQNELSAKTGFQK